jgi:glycosyltransferase involved in cell wall biosynthesis
MTRPAVSIVTVTCDSYFFTRLLVEKVREFVGSRDYEIIVVDRGSRDGTRAWLKAQQDVRLLTRRSWFSRTHSHGETAEIGVRAARYERVVLLDSDAHPLDPEWLANTVDRLDRHNRLGGAIFRDWHQGNPHGWYVHPHFMAFFKSDLDDLIVLRKLHGDSTDTGEEATMRVLAAEFGVVGHPMVFCDELSVGHPRVPTVAGGVFHAWYVTRLTRHEQEVIKETAGQVTRASYLDPLQAKLRAKYGLDY